MSFIETVYSRKKCIIRNNVIPVSITCAAQQDEHKNHNDGLFYIGLIHFQDN